MPRFESIGILRPARQGLLVVVLAAGTYSHAQEAPSTQPGESPSALQPIPSNQPSPPTFEEPMSPREATLERRVQQLEQMVQQLMQSQGAGTSPAVGPGADTTTASPRTTGLDVGSAASTNPPTSNSSPGTAQPDVGSAASANAPSASGGVAAPGQSLPPNPPPSSRFAAPATLESKKVNAKFGPGFELRSDDDEYILQFHNLTQFEYRGYKQSDHDSERDSFLIPRQWWMFSGRITRPIGYFVSFANGFDTISMLDVFMDFDFDPRLRLRAGRFKAPFTYEFFVEPVQSLIQPERSIFFNNFGQNRDNGVMAYGRLFQNTFDYAAGVFNGYRNGYVANTDSKFVTAFINWKPFSKAEGSILENFNIGGSVFGGTNDNLPAPQILRTIVPMSGNAVAGVPFLAFNKDVREIGPMTLWDMHAAWFYRQLAIIGEWGSGFQDYARNANLSNRTHLPVDGYYIQASYLLTGETRSGLGVVKPMRPFNLKRGQFGLGAWELAARFQRLDIGDEVFTNELSDPNLWTNRIWLTDVGFNWYVNQYVKFSFNWEHADFGKPIFFNSSQFSWTNDLFLARIQLFF